MEPDSAGPMVLEGLWPEIKYHLRWWLTLLWGMALFTLPFDPERAVVLGILAPVYPIVFVVGIVGLLHLVARLKGEHRTVVLTPLRLRRRRVALVVALALLACLTITGQAGRAAIDDWIRTMEQQHPH